MASHTHFKLLFTKVTVFKQFLIIGNLDVVVIWCKIDQMLYLMTNSCISECIDQWMYRYVSIYTYKVHMHCAIYIFQRVQIQIFIWIKLQFYCIQKSSGNRIWSCFCLSETGSQGHQRLEKTSLSVAALQEAFCPTWHIYVPPKTTLGIVFSFTHIC